jgi:hypothetical protein
MYVAFKTINDNQEITVFECGVVMALQESMFFALFVCDVFKEWYDVIDYVVELLDLASVKS